MLNPELAYWLAWIWNPKFGATRIATIRRHFVSLKDAWLAPISEFNKTGFDSSLIEEINKYRAVTNPEALLVKLKQLNILAVTLVDDEYPTLLKQIFDPPPVLFYKGDIAILFKTCLAVVGTRKSTPYGLQATTELILQLANQNLVIVSGLAYGIDTIAHRATVQLGGFTAAVLACGLDTIYPVGNISLAQQIIEHGGVIISEFPPGTAPLKQNFPYRNRIIAGLARATLVIEAAESSGALITAKCALEGNREVMAIPGSIFAEHSVGPNNLIKMGAQVVTCAQDILNILGLEDLPQIALPPLSEDQQIIIEHIVREPISIDELVRVSGLPAHQLMSKLSLLELSGHIRDVGGQKYVRVGN